MYPYDSQSADERGEMHDIVLDQLTKQYGAAGFTLAVPTLRIAGGEYFVLCGPSGSGKSTLLRLIAGLETPTQGTITRGTTVLNAVPPHQRGIAYVPQRAALYPHRDVAGNIAIALELEQGHSRAHIAERVRQAAEQVGIPHLLKQRPDGLSGGEAKRVMLARALVRRASVWLLDEPLGQLDSALGEKLSQDLHLLQRLLHLTIIHVTHDPNEALALADRVGLLGGGRLLQTGKPLEVYAQPSSRTVGLHFGRPPMQFFEGQATADRFATMNLNVAQPPASGPWTLGLRVEDVGWADQPGWQAVGTATIHHVQRHGPGWLASLDATHTLRGWCGLEPPPVGTTVTVFFRTEGLHWFDPTGLRSNTSTTP